MTSFLLFLGGKLGGDGSEVLSMMDSDLLFQVGWHAATVGASESSASVGRSSMDLIEGENLGFRVSQRDEAHALVHAKGDKGEVDSLLAATHGANGGEGANRLADETSLHPETTRGIHERLL